MQAWILGTLVYLRAEIFVIPDGVEIFVLPPRGWLPRNEEDAEKLRDGGWCWRLVRALYGLRRSPRWWHRKFDSTVRLRFKLLRDMGPGLRR